MTTYRQDMEKASADLKRWQRKLMLARTKMRKLRARIRRLEKLLTAGQEKRPRRPPAKPLVTILPVVNPKAMPEI